MSFYRNYSWSRWGFYNSSLKIYEYTANNLFVFTNAEFFKDSGYSNIKFVNEAEECLEFIKKYDNKKNENPLRRSWKDVARETSYHIEQLIGG